MATPERAGGWLQTLVPVLEKGGPITTLILGLCAMAMIYGLYRELARVHEVSHLFFQRLESCYQARLEQALRCNLLPSGEER